MPFSPLSLSRSKPTLTDIVALIDKALKRSTKSTLHGSPYLIVDAPLGYVEYKDDITAIFLTAGWTRIEYKLGKHHVDDKIRFYTMDGVDSEPLPGPSVSLTTTTPIITAGIPLILEALAVDSDGVKSIAFYRGTTLLATYNLAHAYYTLQNLTEGMYTITAVATDIKDNQTTSTPLVIRVNPAILPVLVPTITSVSPTVGPVGTFVDIVGTNFSSVTSVLYGGVTQTNSAYNVVSDTHIILTIPVGLAPNNAIAIRYDNNTQTVIAVSTFLVTAAQPEPTLISVSPLVGQTGTTVTIAGTNLNYVTSISFGLSILQPNEYAISNANTMIQFATPLSQFTNNTIVLYYNQNNQSITAGATFTAL